MPISEDEIDFSKPQEAQAAMSKAELRKTHKPIMEKRRRARINHCLNEIKSLILEAMNKDVSIFSDNTQTFKLYLTNFQQYCNFTSLTSPEIYIKLICII